MTKDEIIKDMMRNIPLMIDTLQAESVIVEDHADPQAYQECWKFLKEDVNELILELRKHQNKLDTLQQWCINELNNRRDYSASKSFEVVIEQIEKLK